jgi:hypothetical protein
LPQFNQQHRIYRVNLRHLTRLSAIGCILAAFPIAFLTLPWFPATIVEFLEAVACSSSVVGDRQLPYIACRAPAALGDCTEAICAWPPRVGWACCHWRQSSSFVGGTAIVGRDGYNRTRRQRLLEAEHFSLYRSHLCVYCCSDSTDDCCCCRDRNSNEPRRVSYTFPDHERRLVVSEALWQVHRSQRFLSNVVDRRFDSKPRAGSILSAIWIFRQSVHEMEFANLMIKMRPIDLLRKHSYHFG